MRIWFDVEDLFDYATHARRPSGIQRLAFEIYNAAAGMDPDRVGFVRHRRSGSEVRFAIVPWKEVRELFLRLAGAEQPVEPARLTSPVTGARRAIVPKTLQPLAKTIPLEARTSLRQAARLQATAISLGWSGLKAMRRRPARAPNPEAGQAVAPVADELSGRPLLAECARGDVLCSFGSPWFQQDYDRLIADSKARGGLRVSILAYDLIPVVRPEFVDENLRRAFGAWWQRNLPLADRLFAISRSTARDVEAWCDRLSLPIARPVIPLPIGTGFSTDTPGGGAGTERTRIQDFVLFVSTIEPRKNHDLAFRVWRRLLETMPAERVPKLVFAGRIGWMSGDLIQRIRNADHLDGKLVIVEDPTDGEIADLYRRCRFTLYPSLYEGWGLPVTESLSFGKACIASDSSSLPEAGGQFCRYIDPDNVTAATAAIQEAIENPAIIAELERRIATEFRPVAWQDTARAVFDHLGTGA
jgi:glycosyltransferase involved in cell wall biosynthesis